MPVLLFVLLIVLIAQIGFWDTFAAILGAAAMLVLFVLIAVGAASLGAYLLYRKVRRGF